MKSSTRSPAANLPRSRRARDRDLGREVAIKQIHAQFLADPRQLARYWQEAQLLASLQHPNILTIYDVVRARGWLILELMRGSLQPAAAGDPMDLDQLRLVLANCLNGLHFLHGNGVIHGDIKPSNILVAPPNRIKLGDFGLARRASNEEGSLLKGTTKYMAPELIVRPVRRGGPGQRPLLAWLHGLRIDGRLAFRIAPAHADHFRPQQADGLDDVARHGRRQAARHPTRLAGVPDDLARVIQRLIAKDQSQRYRSAGEALRELQTPPGAVSGLPPTADLDAEAEAVEAVRRKKKVRKLSLIAGGVAAMLCMLIVVLMLGHHKKPPQARFVDHFKGKITDVLVASKELGREPRRRHSREPFATTSPPPERSTLPGRRHVAAYDRGRQ